MQPENLLDVVQANSLFRDIGDIREISQEHRFIRFYMASERYRRSIDSSGLHDPLLHSVGNLTSANPFKQAKSGVVLVLLEILFYLIRQEVLIHMIYLKCPLGIRVQRKL